MNARNSGGGGRPLDPHHDPNRPQRRRLDGLGDHARRPAVGILPPIQPAAPELAQVSTPTTHRRVKQRHLGKRRHHWLRWSVLAVVLIIAVSGGFIGLKVVLAANKVITKAGKGAPALDGTITTTTLKGEGDGRINILALGIGGQGHDGSNLSDTMMVISIDPKTKDVAMMSIPRDLYVKIPGYGYGKINAANAYGGPALAEQVVSSILNLPIDYYVQVDFSGFKQAVDAVGGVDINVPTVLYDHEYPCDTGYGICPYYQVPGQIHMNGELALEYSRCRHDQPTGDCGDDTGRAARQQQILTALRQKTLTAGTLTNPIKIGALIDAVGAHVKTDLQLKDMEKLATIIKGVDPSKIVNKVPQFNGPDAILTATSNAAGSVLEPKAGEFDYSALQDMAHSIFVDHYITSENAVIQVQNGSGVVGLAGQVVTTLSAYHYNVLAAATAVTPVTQTVIYDYTNGKKPYTINYLQERFGVKAVKMTGAPLAPAPSTTASPTTTPTSTQTPQIVIVLGSDYTGASATTAVSSSP
jgi:LCP family protein required for cell wall assembly